ncbi:uncharacterized protein [Canis lupus baileyi]|uniref:uncharacterized protein n=1 Tax=Canis lupus baileyi TaxID=143281 RepID=UPI003B978E0A
MRAVLTPHALFSEWLLSPDTDRRGVWAVVWGPATCDPRGGGIVSFPQGLPRPQLLPQAAAGTARASVPGGAWLQGVQAWHSLPQGSNPISSPCCQGDRLWCNSRFLSEETGQGRSAGTAIRGRSEHPVLGAEQPSFGAEHPSLGAEHPSLRAEQSSLGAEQSSLGAKHPTLGPKYPALGAKHPSLGAKQPSLGDEHPVLQAKHPALGPEHPTLGAEHPTVGAEQPSLGAEHPALRVEHLPRGPSNLPWGPSTQGPSTPPWGPSTPPWGRVPTLGPSTPPWGPSTPPWGPSTPPWGRAPSLGPSTHPGAEHPALGQRRLPSSRRSRAELHKCLRVGGSGKSWTDWLNPTSYSILPPQPPPLHRTSPRSGQATPAWVPAAERSHDRSTSKGAKRSG